VCPRQIKKIRRSMQSVTSSRSYSYLFTWAILIAQSASTQEIRRDYRAAIRAFQITRVYCFSIAIGAVRILMESKENSDLTFHSIAQVIKVSHDNNNVMVEVITLKTLPSVNVQQSRGNKVAQVKNTPIS
jgi:hypothetical protein